MMHCLLWYHLRVIRVYGIIIIYSWGMLNREGPSHGWVLMAEESHDSRNSAPSKSTCALEEFTSRSDLKAVIATSLLQAR